MESPVPVPPLSESLAPIFAAAETIVIAAAEREASTVSLTVAAVVLTVRTG